MRFSRSALAASRAALRTSRRRTFWSGSSNIMQDGTIEMVIGGTLLTAVVVDRVLQYQQNQQRDSLMNELRSSDSRSSADLQELEEWYNMPALFDCTIRKLPLNLDGYKCLTGVNVGDVIEVLEEKTGPGDMYNLCRTLDKKGRPMSVGWFPTMYLEKK